MSTLSFDAERSVESKFCDACGSGYVLAKGFIYDDEEPHTVYFAALHDHGSPEAWIDVILGTFGTEDFSDHVTFGCRVGAVEGQSEPPATLVPAAQPYSASALFGRTSHERTPFLTRCLRRSEIYDREIVMLEREIHRRLRHDRGYQAVQAINGVGRTIAAIIVVEVGDVTRFPSARHLCSWAGLTPGRHESDRKGHDTGITKQGSKLLRWALIEGISRYHAGPHLAAEFPRDPAGRRRVAIHRRSAG